MKEQLNNSLLAGDPTEQQVGGDHYVKYKIQPVEIINDLHLGYIRGNILKYLVRYKDKNGLEDLKKAFHYVRIYEKMLVREYSKINTFIDQLDGINAHARMAIRMVLEPSTCIPRLQDELVSLIQEEGGTLEDFDLEGYPQQVQDEDRLLK